jgi:hypothetical protein
MNSRDAKCVFVADDVAKATVTVTWLGHQGIPAKVMDSMTLGGLEGLTAWTGVSARGIEVWVLQPDDAERARVLIEEHKESQSRLEGEGLDSQPVLAFCEICGNSSEFPGEQRNTSQDCPECSASMTVHEGEEAVDESSVRPSHQTPMSNLRRLQKPIILFAVGCMGLYLVFLLLTFVYSALSGRS